MAMEKMGVGSDKMSQMSPRKAGMTAGGHLYMQTNETRNFIVHYRRGTDGALTEVERCATGGAGSGTFKPISGQDSAPNSFEGAGSVILSPDRRLLFATNGGDNSVSSFAVGDQGRLKLIDTKPTGNTVEGKSGTAKSLAYSPSKGMLYVVHSFGPDHIRLISVSSDGKLTPRMERYTANTPEKQHRVPTMGVLSPDEKFLLVGTTFDVPIAISGTYPDGSPVLWVPGPDGKPRSVASNAPDPDGIVVFRVNANGTLSDASFQDGGGGSPFYIAFLHNRPDTFIIGYAVGDGVSLGRIDEDGRIGLDKIVPIDTRRGKIAELCWLSVSPDDRFLYATVFGYGDVTSFRIDGPEIRVAMDPACPEVEGDGTFRALCGDVSSGPSDNWVSPDGAFFYQIYGNASRLVGYATNPDGSLEEVTSVAIPYNSPEGLAGF
ncbi:MAG TPA: beta-propeller fold lactonase family protein [Steroidobacteraceae bacterium]|jgi:6-phosphogluconolactonase (cycloisomerase 2 family)|nr:beta-propeller fold lactonase family protein [Steroidobacteraceae bacterium]